MGHTRLGKIPTSRKWEAVVALVTAFDSQNKQLADDIASVSKLTLEAAEAGLKEASRDAGVRFTFYLLTQIALSAKSTDAQAVLKEHGIDVKTAGNAVDLMAQFHRAVDRFVRREGKRTDFSEMARQAAGTTLANALQSPQLSLFDSTEHQFRQSLKEFASSRRFADTGQQFFGNFMGRFLNFYLSRITAAQMGSAGLSQIGSISEFNGALDKHCTQSALVLRNFCGEWFSKTEYVEEITLKNSGGFVHHAFNKLGAELKRQQGER